MNKKIDLAIDQSTAKSVVDKQSVLNDHDSAVFNDHDSAVFNDHDSAVFNDHDLLHDQDETQQPEETFLNQNYTFLETTITAPIREWMVTNLPNTVRM